MNKNLLALLTTALSPTDAQKDALTTWVDTHGKAVLDAARECLTGEFDWAELGKLAEVASKSASALGSAFEGLERAEIAQIILSASARAVLPDAVEHWVLPLLEGDGVKALIEAAFRKWVSSPPLKEIPRPAPVTDDATLPAPSITEGAGS